MGSSGKAARKKKARYASTRVKKNQSPAFLASLAASDASTQSDESLLSLVTDINTRVHTLEDTLSEVGTSVSASAKQQVNALVTYLHSIRSPFPEEGAEETPLKKEKPAKDQKAKALSDLLGSSDSTHDRKASEADSGKADLLASLSALGTPKEGSSEAGDGVGSLGFDISSLDDLSPAPATTAGGEVGASLGFDLGGLEDLAEPEAQSSAASDLLKALGGDSNPSHKVEEPKYEFGNDFAGLTDLDALTRSLVVAKDPEPTDLSALTSAADSFDTSGIDLSGLDDFAVKEDKALDVSDVDLSALTAAAGDLSAAEEKSASGFDLSGLDDLKDLASLDKEPAGADLADLSSLAGADLSALTASLDTPAGGALSYDDFLAALQPGAAVAKKEVATSDSVHLGDDGLVRAFGSKDEINLAGMKRSKKKTVRWGPGGKGKPVYQMEDTHYIGCPFLGSDDGALFCVFDGHVDKNAAEEAKKVFPKEFQVNLKAAKMAGVDVGHVLRKTFLSTDAKLIEYDMEGATATGVYIWRNGGDRYLQAANVGDSNAFLCRDGKAVWLSVEHKVNDPDERKRLMDAGMQLSEGQSRINGLAVSRALGDHFVKEHYPVTAEPFVSDAYKLGESDDKLVVASDGLWDIVSGQEAMDIIKPMSDPAAMAAKLVETAVKSRKCNDNITVIVVLL